MLSHFPDGHVKAQRGSPEVGGWAPRCCSHVEVAGPMEKPAKFRILRASVGPTGICSLEIRCAPLPGATVSSERGTGGGWGLVGVALRVEVHWGQFGGADRLFSGLWHSFWEIGAPSPGQAAGTMLCVTRSQLLPGLFWPMPVALGLLRTVWDGASHLHIFS